MTGVRVRFAPSPTGQLHVGNARTALVNWLVARRQDGTLVLRIEDTDIERSTAASEQAIVEDLRWLGLDWHEGPDVGGPHAPYRQSERLERYQAVAHALLDRRQAYYCFCTPATLEAERAAALAAGQPPGYGGRCRALDPDEAARRVASGEPAAVRFAMPSDRHDVTFHDIVRGDVVFERSVLRDFVILRSDGRPAYNFSVVVDDADMAITHVVRGEDHISNTPRQVLLYEAIGREKPAFAHLPLVLGPDHAPLSKRHGATSVAEFRERGYLPEALVNYLALLGWSPGEGEEIVPLAEMANRFALESVSHSAGVFDPGKLAWINRHYMKEAESARLVRESLKYFARAGYARVGTDAAVQYLESLLPMAIGSVDRLEEIPERLHFVFDWTAARAAALVRAEADGPRAVAAFAAEIGQAGPLERDAFREAVTRAKQATGLKGRALLHPIRAALTAAESGPELDLAVPAIDRGARLPASAGLTPIPACADRAAAVAKLVE